MSDGYRDPHGGEFDQSLALSIDTGRIKDNRKDFSNQRASIYLPKHVKLKDLERCPTCGGLVKMPCVFCSIGG